MGVAPIVVNPLQGDQAKTEQGFLPTMLELTMIAIAAADKAAEERAKEQARLAAERKAQEEKEAEAKRLAELSEQERKVELARLEAQKTLQQAQQAAPIVTSAPTETSSLAAATDIGRLRAIASQIDSTPEGTSIFQDAPPITEITGEIALKESAIERAILALQQNETVQMNEGTVGFNVNAPNILIHVTGAVVLPEGTEVAMTSDGRGQLQQDITIDCPAEIEYDDGARHRFTGFPTTLKAGTAFSLVRTGSDQELSQAA